MERGDLGLYSKDGTNGGIMITYAIISFLSFLFGFAAAAVLAAARYRDCGAASIIDGTDSTRGGHKRDGMKRRADGSHAPEPNK